MTERIIGRVTSNGHSCIVTLPKKLAKAAGVIPWTYVEVSLVQDGKGILVKPHKLVE